MRISLVHTQHIRHSIADWHIQIVGVIALVDANAPSIGMLNPRPKGGSAANHLFH